VKLTKDKNVYTTQLQVVADPRSKHMPADRKAQFDLSLKLYQLLGDMKEGDGEPKLCLFGEEVTPNHHALARQFVLLDNFYVDGEVSADGHEWSMGAFATDYVEKTWPLSYRGDRRVPYPAEGALAIARPAGGYLWDRAAARGVTYRSYGEFIANGRTPDDPPRRRVVGAPAVGAELAGPPVARTVRPGAVPQRAHRRVEALPAYRLVRVVERGELQLGDERHCYAPISSSRRPPA